MTKMTNNNMSGCVKGAHDQLFTIKYPTGEVAHYLWGFAGEYDVTVRLPKESYQKLLEFLAKSEENWLGDIEGVMASELPDPMDERYVPMGAPVLIYLDFMDRSRDESAWIFDIHRAEVVAA